MFGKDALPEKDLLKIAGIIKRFEHSPLGSELKKQTDTAKRQYQRLGKSREFDKKEDDNKKQALKKYNKSDLIYDSNHIFYK